MSMEKKRGFPHLEHTNNIPWHLINSYRVHSIAYHFQYVLFDRRYTTMWCNVYITQLTTELHVSTLQGHHQAYKIMLTKVHTVILPTGSRGLHVQYTLTFRHHASYIQGRQTVPSQSTLVMYLVNKYIQFSFRISLAIFVYSSTKCRVFPNVTLLGS